MRKIEETRVYKAYECDICGKHWDTEERCKQCESSHKGINAVRRADYDPLNLYPYNITVEFDNGVRKEYEIVDEE